MPIAPESGTVEERIWYPLHEKKEILKRTYGICACCGKKLTPATMTVDHLIPRIRGGSNGPENLCALCYDCNQKKGGDFYLPAGCYHAIRQTPRFRDMTEYVIDWYRNLPEDGKTDLVRQPLITKAAMVGFSLGASSDFKGHRKPKLGSTPILNMKWETVGYSMVQEVEAVTGRYLWADRGYLVHDMVGLKEEKPLAGAYIMKKQTTDKLLILALVRYVEEDAGFYLYVPWADVSNAFLAAGVRTLVELLMLSLVRVAGKRITGYVMESILPHAFDQFLKVSEMDPFIGDCYEDRGWVDADGVPHEEVWVGRHLAEGVVMGDTRPGKLKDRT